MLDPPVVQCPSNQLADIQPDEPAINAIDGLSIGRKMTVGWNPADGNAFRKHVILSEVSLLAFCDEFAPV